MSRNRSLPLAALSALLALAACAAPGGFGAPGGTAAAPVPADYAALPDTLVCVVDRAAPTGLRNLAAKKAADGGVLLFDAGEVRVLEDVHPVALLAGYAGNEGWLERRETLVFGPERYVLYQGQRRVPIDLLESVGEFQAIPLFAARGEDAPHPTLYVPVRPGCVFQPYVRSDLVPR